MLKKTGIVVAAVATGLIGFSSLAFAHDWDRHGPDTVEINRSYEADNSVDRDQVNECGFIQNQESSTVVERGLLGDLLPPLGGALGDQDQIGNCINLGDITGAAAPPVG